MHFLDQSRFDQQIHMWQFSAHGDRWVFVTNLSYINSTRHSSLNRKLSQNIAKYIILIDTESVKKNIFSFVVPWSMFSSVSLSSDILLKLPTFDFLQVLSSVSLATDSMLRIPMLDFLLVFVEIVSPVILGCLLWYWCGYHIYCAFKELLSIPTKL